MRKYLIALFLGLCFFANTQVLLNNKKFNFSTLTTSATVNLSSDNDVYFISGTKSLSSNFSIGVTGTPVDGQAILLFYDGTGLTTNSNVVTVFGFILTDYEATSKLIFLSIYKTSSWETRVIRDVSTKKWISKDDLSDTVVDGTTLELNATNGLQVKDGGIDSAKISALKPIPYYKLYLDGKIDSADISATAAIPYDKLYLVGKVDSGDIKPAAKIPFTKMLPLTASKVPVLDASGFVTASAVTSTTLGYLDATSSVQTQINTKTTSGAIVNADVNASAAIAVSKLAALTASRAVVSDGSGLLSAATVTSTELGYLSGATSNIQAQLAVKGGASGTYTLSSTASITLNASATDYYKLNSTSNPISITLPAANLFASGKAISITMIFSAGSDRVTVAAAGADNISNLVGANVSSYVFAGATGEVHVFASNGTDTWIMLR